MYELDLSGVKTVEEFHARVRKALKTPEYYGDNLDSLYDVLSEVKGRIHVVGCEAVDEDMTAYIDRFRAMCLDARDENPLLEIVFA